MAHQLHKKFPDEQVKSLFRERKEERKEGKEERKERSEKRVGP